MRNNILKILFFFYVAFLCADFVTFKLNINWSLSFWRAQWQTFSYSDSKFSKLVVTGVLEDNRKVSVPMNRWFGTMVGYETHRYDLVSRSYDSLEPLAAYVCRQYNQGALKGLKLKAVNISSAIWSKQLGERKPFNQMSKKQVMSFQHIVNQKCF